MKKILVWGLTNNRAGTEAAIVNLASNAHDVSFDYLCYEEPLNHWDKLSRNSSRYFVIPSKMKDPVGNHRAMHEFMKQHASEYDAVWFNINEASNIDLLKLADRYNIPKRIVHMHNSQLVDVPLVRLFHGMNIKKLRRLGTDYWACSEAAASFLHPGGAVRVVPNIIDTESIAFSSEKRDRFRKQFDIEGSFVIGSVGRLTNQKDPAFLIALLPSLLEKDPSVRLVLVGDGELRRSLEELCESLGISDKVIFAGIQDDMQACLSAFDVYAQPSRYEGLGISIVEAQFNGLPCVVSDVVPPECKISTGIELVSTNDRDSWVKALLESNRSRTELLPEAEIYDSKNASALLDELFG